MTKAVSPSNDAAQTYVAAGERADRLTMGMTTVFAGIAIATGAMLPCWLVSLITIAMIIPFAIGWGQFMNHFFESSATNVPIVVAICGILAVLLVWWTDDFGASAIIFGLVVILAFIAEMFRPAPRKDTLMSVSGVVIGGIFAGLSASWVGLVEELLAHRSMLPIGLVIAVIGIAAMFFTHRGIHISMLLIVGLIAGLVAATILVSTRVLELMHVQPFGSIAIAQNYPTSAMFIVMSALSLTIAALVGFASFFADYSRHSFKPIERVAFGLMPVMLSGLPLYAVLHVIGG